MKDNETPVAVGGHSKNWYTGRVFLGKWWQPWTWFRWRKAVLVKELDLVEVSLVKHPADPNCAVKDPAGAPNKNGDAYNVNKVLSDNPIGPDVVHISKPAAQPTSEQVMAESMANVLAKEKQVFTTVEADQTEIDGLVTDFDEAKEKAPEPKPEPKRYGPKKRR